MTGDSTLYDAGPPDSHVPTLSEVGAAVMLVVGALAWLYVARVCRRPL